jgi:uncharacterized protein (TIGR02145 family)
MGATASLSIQVVEPPLLTNQPLPQSVPIGQNAVFTIGHNSTNSTLQWQTDLGWGFQNLTNAGQYSGVNTPTLTVSNTAFQNNNQMFRCILFDGICSGDTSNIVSLSVVARQNTANVPARFNFQSVIRDTTGALVANRSLGVRITLNRGPQMGTLYSETHQLTSNSNGLITTSIGGGTPVVSSMDSIDWSLGDVYIKTEVDVNGGSNYEMLSSNQLLSVPYALYAQNSGSGAPGPVGPQGPQGSLPPGTQAGEINYWNGSSWVTIPPGVRNQSLIMCDGVPTWGGCLPEVTTSMVTSIFADRAICGGSVVSEGGGAVVNRGIAYGTSSNPTISGSVIVNGSGLGTYNSTITGLTALTSYFVRAYATNSVGTAYGNEVSFSTPPIPAFACGTSTVSDVDGNSYNIVQIGAQCWMQSNLKVSKYRNGDVVPTELSNANWQNATSGSYSIYNNNPVNDALYGKLYNHYAVTDNRGLCPTGWHVPTDGEWNILVQYLDPNADITFSANYQSVVAGNALLSTLTQPTPGGWVSTPGTASTNSSGFTALPGGRRDGNGDFGIVSDHGYWWTSSLSTYGAWYRALYHSGLVVRGSTGRTFGFSVRCLRD